MTKERNKMRLLLPRQWVEQREDCRAVSTCDLIAISKRMLQHVDNKTPTVLP